MGNNLHKLLLGAAIAALAGGDVAGRLPALLVKARLFGRRPFCCNVC